MCDNQEYFIKSILSLLNRNFNRKREPFLKEALSEAFSSRTMHVVAVFCPSYKNGITEFGYNAEIGFSTKNNINNLVRIQEICDKCDIQLKITLLHSNVFIENKSRLLKLKIDYQTELDDNFLSFCRYVSASSLKSQRVYRLSNFINENINKLPHDMQIRNYQDVINRNREFYVNKLGWTEKSFSKRMDELVVAYGLISDLVKSHYGHSFLYWTESILERTFLLDETINVIIPKIVTNDDNILPFENTRAHDYYMAGEYNLVKLGATNLFDSPAEIIIPRKTFLNNGQTIINKLNTTKKLRIAYLSESDVNTFHGFLCQNGFKKVIRSPREVIYDAHKLHALDGRKFQSLRREKRKCLSQNFEYKKNNLADAQYVIYAWREKKRIIYEKSRTIRELSLVSYLANKKTKISTVGFIQYYNNHPTGLLIYEKVNGVMINIICKGLNHINKFSSSALYFKLFEDSYNKNCRYINDGELGFEKGSVRHKMKYKPILFKTSWDYEKEPNDKTSFNFK